MNVLLDLDGTLTDPREGILACIRHALVKLGRTVPEDSELERCIGPPLRDSFSRILPGEEVEAAVAAYRDRFRVQGLFENTVYEGIPEALDTLAARGARLMVATSKPGAYAVRILEHFRLADSFSAIHGSELDGRRSDKTTLIAHVLKSHNLRAEETVMVGDRSFDAIGAVANNVAAAGVLWGYGTRQELIGAGADRILEAPADLAGLTGRIPAAD